MKDLLSSLPTEVNLVLFAAMAAGVWLAGSRLTYLADAVSDRLMLAKSIVGVVFLASTTSLPEIVTTFSAAVIESAELVLNNLFGGIALQTAVLALADIWSRGAITNYPRKANHALEATLLVVLLACLQIVFTLNEPVVVFDIGMGSLLVGVAYVLCVMLLRRYDANNDWVPVDLPEGFEVPESHFRGTELSEVATSRLLVLGSVACVAIVVFGVALVNLAEVLAAQTGLGPSFLGVTLLAGATSLPELATTVAAARMGAYTLAISNIFGSNLIMVGLVLPADLLYLSGPILSSTTASTKLAVATGTLVTGIYLVGLIIRRKPSIGPLGIDSVAVLVIYLLSLPVYLWLA